MSHKRGLVSAMRSGYDVEVHRHLDTPGWDTFVEKHEFGHHWLVGCLNQGGHPSLYRDCFHNWREPRFSYRFTRAVPPPANARAMVRTVYRTMKIGEVLSIDYIDEDGKTVHIDFIRGPLPGERGW